MRTTLLPNLSDLPSFTEAEIYHTYRIIGLAAEHLELESFPTPDAYNYQLKRLTNYNEEFRAILGRVNPKLHAELFN